MTDETEPIPMTLAAYQRWLRAQRPPFEWFASLTEEDQAALADAGDDYAQSFCREVAFCVLQPEAAVNGADAVAVAGAQQPSDVEADLVSRLAAAAARKLIDGARARPAATGPSAPPGPTMAGLTERRQQREAEAAAGKRLLGRPGRPAT